MDRIGTYKSEGAVKSISITEDSKLIIIGSAVNGIFVFHVETGEQITILPTNQLKQIEFASGNKQFFLIHNAGSKVTIVDIFSLSVIDKKIDPDLSYNQAYDENDKKTLIKSDVAYTKGAWGYLNKTLILGTSRGAIDIYHRFAFFFRLYFINIIIQRLLLQDLRFSRLASNSFLQRSEAFKLSCYLAFVFG